MGNTPCREADANVHTSKDAAIERARQLKGEYGAGINANLVVENAVGTGWVVELMADASNGVGDGASSSKRSSQPGHSRRGRFASETGRRTGGDPADGVLFGVGVSVPYATNVANGVFVMPNMKQGGDLVQLSTNAHNQRCSHYRAVAGANGIVCELLGLPLPLLVEKMWDLATAETQRAQQQRRDEDDAALRLAKRASRWRSVTTEQSFMERSRRQRPGAVKTMESYLRDDVHCGIDACARCEAQPHVRVFRSPRRLQKDHAEYVVPDAFALLQVLELLEDPSFGARVSNMLVLETVAHEALKLAPPRDATRLKNFFRDENRRMVDPCCVVLFPNQHHVATAVERAVSNESLESQASRDRRALVQTLTWYAAQHVAPSTKLVFLTPDVDSQVSRQLRGQLQVEVVTCEAFVRKRFKHPDFLVELAENTADAVRWYHAQQQSEAATSGVGEWAPHLPHAQLVDRVTRGDLIQGRLDVSAHNPNEAFVIVDKRVSGNCGFTKVFVCGREAMNRGIHGDDVIIELLPTTEWTAPKSDRVLVHYATTDEPNDKEKDDDAVATTTADAVPTAKVVGIARRSSAFVVATVLSSTMTPGDDIALAIPMDRRLPKVRIRSQRMDTLLDQRLKVVVDHWPLDSMYPNGHYTAVLGEFGSLPAELSAILVQHELEDAPFCEAALACLPEQCEIDKYAIHECSTAKRSDSVPLLDWQVPLEEVQQRRDLRATHRVFSVDPPGCQDIDDAMSVRRLPNGNLELGVHIADVSYFVAHDSPLDFEGRSRATTVYLVGQRLDMLPAVLSADLCSLHEHVDRVAVSVLWELDPTTLEMLPNRTWFGRTIINSCASMTYDQAHRILQGVNADTGTSNKKPWRRGVAGGPVPLDLQRELEGDLRLLTRISRKLAKARGEDGGLDLSRSETFSLNVSELSDVEIVMKESLEIHATIAELMILANGDVARKIVDVFPSSALVRRHVPPAGPRFEQLIHLADAKAITIDATNNYTLQQSLVRAEASGRADAKTMALLKSLAVRVMAEAEYVCVSEVDDVAHYGLGLEFYTHFTSPIRRYADIVVHRQLLAALAQETDKPKETKQMRQKSSGVALPPSLVPSVLEEQTAVNALATTMDQQLHLEDEEEEDVLFPSSVLVPLAQHLNHKNRAAKQASRSCEELFLALYFSTHTVRTLAIVTALKQNGFLVYVPTYDLRAPVYVRDRDGHVQLDPLLCGVRIVDTLPATGAFAAAENTRLIPKAHIELDAEHDQLHVVVDDKSRGCTFSILDELEVEISCDLSGSNARVPQLQLQLVGRVEPSSRKKPVRTTMTTSTSSTKPTSRESSIPELQRIVQTRSAAEAAARQASPRTPSGRTTKPNKTTMYELLMPEHRPTISPPKKTLLTRPSHTKPKSTKADEKPASVRRRGPGRLMFGDYEPPKAEPYQKNLASYLSQRSDDVEDAMTIQRFGDSNALDLKQLERDATARTAKLASEHRHDRINARRKAN